MGVFEQIFESAPDGLLVVDHEGLVREANVQAARMFGYSRDELLGSLVEKLVPPHLEAAHGLHRSTYNRRPRVRAMGAGLKLQALAC